jgi:hypothetical protein
MQLGVINKNNSKAKHLYLGEDMAPIASPQNMSNNSSSKGAINKSF